MAHDHTFRVVEMEILKELRNERVQFSVFRREAKSRASSSISENVELFLHLQCT